MALKLEVGQKVWVVENYYRREGREASVTKVGRKWADLDIHNKVELETGYLKGDPSPGRVWESKEAHDAEVALEQAWRSFKLLCNNQLPPEDLTVEKIQAAIKVLGL